MFKLPENVEEAVQQAKLAIDGLNAIANVVAPAKAESAGSIVTIIKVILTTIQEGFDEKISPERVRDELTKLTGSLVSNDAAADAALANKFKED